MTPQEEWIKEFDKLRLKQACHCEDCYNTIKSFIQKTQEEAREEGYKHGYKLGSEINIPVKGRLTETWNLAIQACVDSLLMCAWSDIDAEIIRTSLLSIKK